MTYLDHVGPHYFTTAGTRLVMGREFDERDNPAGPGVAVVNQEFVNHFFNGQNPVGKNLYRRGEEQRYQIVGVVQDIRTDVRQRAEAHGVFFAAPDGRQVVYDAFPGAHAARAGGAAGGPAGCRACGGPRQSTWHPSIRRISC